MEYILELYIYSPFACILRYFHLLFIYLLYFDVFDGSDGARGGLGAIAHRRKVKSEFFGDFWHL